MHTTVPAVLVVGLLTVICFYSGQAARRIKLPTIIGFMTVGIVLGPSCIGLVDAKLAVHLSFLTQIALGFVALSIGLELPLAWLRKQGMGIVVTILGQWLGAFVAVTIAIYITARFVSCPNGLAGPGHILAMALIFGALATATAPAGTVAVIREYKAKGNLTRALYAVVGYDDALAVIIFGFALAFARNLLAAGTGNTLPVIHSLLYPFGEVLLSLILGAAVGMLFCILVRNIRQSSDRIILLVGFVLAVTGLSSALHLSFVLTNMVFGLLVVNTQAHNFVQRLREDLQVIMPLLFVFLFSLAGTGLDIVMLPHLGIIGIVYILARSVGKIMGANVSATLAGMDVNIRKYLGIGLLSQAGVAIGLALMANHELRGLGVQIETINGNPVYAGDALGTIILTTTTASCVVFEIVGPILARIALKKAGEIE